jgi:hypothetical protein
VDQRAELRSALERAGGNGGADREVLVDVEVRLIGILVADPGDAHPAGVVRRVAVQDEVGAALAAAVANRERAVARLREGPVHGQREVVLQRPGGD